MREILFRGKRVDNGEWVEGNYGERFDGEGIVSCISKPTKETISGTLCYDIDPYTVGQYTGLKDRNGKEIFEGDIVLKKTYNGKKSFPVTFGGGMFHCGFGGGSSTALHRYSLEDRQIEVVGNIHDNPDMIDGGRQ